MDSFPDQVKALYQALDPPWTQQRMIREASTYEHPGTSMETIRNAVTGRRGGWPSRAAVEAVAHALQVPPETFAVYRLIVARELLDPDVVGVDRALATADAMLGPAATPRSPAEIAAEAARLRDGKTRPSRAAGARRQRKAREA
jgi:hypothetical protein